jgi:hypothetical protein
LDTNQSAGGALLRLGRRSLLQPRRLGAAPIMGLGLQIRRRAAMAEALEYLTVCRATWVWAATWTHILLDRSVPGLGSAAVEVSDRPGGIPVKRLNARPKDASDSYSSGTRQDRPDRPKPSP